MTIRYTKAAAVENSIGEAVFAEQASQANIAADIVTAQAAIIAAAAAAGLERAGDFRQEIQHSETFGCDVIRLSLPVELRRKEKAAAADAPAEAVEARRTPSGGDARRVRLASRRARTGLRSDLGTTGTGGSGITIRGR